MQLCRAYLAKLDTLGWTRSYLQRLFHDDFLKAFTRSFWKLEPPGQFARDHQRVLRVNSWDHIAQEILISTPRRFGKTIRVSMFCAAMLLSCPGVEISIYSTCKRISQKILRNVQKIALMLADADYSNLNFGVKRIQMSSKCLVTYSRVYDRKVFLKACFKSVFEKVCNILITLVL